MFSIELGSHTRRPNSSGVGRVGFVSVHLFSLQLLVSTPEDAGKLMMNVLLKIYCKGFIC